MFDTTWSHQSAQSLPPSTSYDDALRLLHDFETVMRLNPDVKSIKPAQPKNGMAKSASPGQQFYEVQDSIPFIPKSMWRDPNVSYNAAFRPMDDGCDVEVHAPGGFTSTNHWRLVRDTKAGATRELESAGEWRVEIRTDAKCSRAFAGLVKGQLQNSHAQLEAAFIEKVKQQGAKGDKRPGVPRRRSSWPMQ